MSDTARFVRRNRVDERVAVGIAAVAGAVAVFAGAEPTGSAAVDAALVFTSVAAVVWASASAPWWAPAAASGVAAGIALDPLLAAIGFGGFVAGLIVGVRQQDQSEMRAVVGAIAMNVVIRSELGGFLGLSAIIGVGLGLLLFVTGVRRRPSAIRRPAWIALGTIGGFILVAVGLLAVSALSTRSDLTAASRLANRGVQSLDDGDYVVSAAQFADAADAFERVDSRLSGPLALPSRLVPGVAQNVRAASTLAEEAASTSGVAAEALAAVDPGSLRFVDGAIDLDAIRAVEAPLVDVQQVLVDLRSTVQDIRSPWLLDRVQTELVELEERIANNEPALADAVDAVRIAPQVLGGDGERRYLMLLTTPSESRGMTGFAGAYAQVAVDDGRLDVTSFSGIGELSAAAFANGATCADCPPEFLARYGPFNIGTPPEYTVGNVAWSNFTMGGHFPDVARTAQILYPQSGGAPVDGVIAMDPFVLQALVGYTGPIDVPEFDTVVTADNAATFLLNEQYALEEEFGNQEAALQTLGDELFDRLLAGALPAPADIARDLGPLVNEHRLIMWTDDPTEQALFDRYGLTGALPTPGDDGGFSAYLANGGNSKIDYFLRRDTDVTVEAESDGTRRLVATVTFHNDAPPSGQPEVVLRNTQGLPLGSSFGRLTFYGPGEPVVALKGSTDILADLAHLPEAGWTASSAYDVIGPGESATYRLEYALGSDADGVTAPTLWTQPLAERSVSE
jgi:hypothetical protein